MNKALGFITLTLFFLLVSSAVTTSHNGFYSGYEGYGSLNYYYYEGYDYNHEDSTTYSRLPVVAGPYERHYTMFSGTNRDYLYDDYNHFDNYLGYRDLDLFRPDGGIDVFRNPQANLGPVDSNYPLTYNASKINHVYGMLPDGSVYRKHYYHEHEWDFGYDDYYGYNSFGYDVYSYGYTPNHYYATRPIYTRNCYVGCN